ncbi:MAG: hypothetical protein AAGH15_07970 [Myxococcota bacterium]
MGEALVDALARVRASSPHRRVVVLTPSAANGAFARRELAFATPFIRVHFSTPLRLHDELARPALRAKGRKPEPEGWLRHTLQRLVRHDDGLGRHGEAMRDPGWMPALTAAVQALESSGLGAGELEGLADLASDVGARGALLGRLLRGVGSARDAERIASPALVADAAAEAASRRDDVGVVLLGDARLPRSVARTLERYLRARPVARVALPGLDALPPARFGLTASAPESTTVIEVNDRAPEVTLVRTPDPLREIAEAVREAQAAVRAGVPLDRIAIVLPDPGHAFALGAALERAELPATWLTGPPLAETPAGRFLLHLLGLKLGEDGVPAWYELLQLPGLRLRARLGADATRGRARWRRLLARCGAYRGASRLCAALEAYREERRAALAEDADAEALEREEAAFGSLLGALQALDGAVDADAAKPLGAWARDLVRLLAEWWTLTPDHRVLATLLESWGRSDAGPALSLVDARLTLADTLAARELLRGSLRDLALRVVSPMQLLGGAFDRVVVTGLQQGRFPRKPSADPVLSDALVEALEDAHGAGLFHSRDRAALERRRFAAIRSAAVGALWLSSPGQDLQGRPLLPSQLLLELESQARGERVGYAQLALDPRGSRSRSHPTDPTMALGNEEHLLARLHGPDADARDAALVGLADHRWARRLLRFHLALERLRRGERAADLRPYAGFVDPALLPALSGAPLRPRELAELVASPARFLYRRALGAYAPARLYEHFDPFASKLPVREALAVADDVLSAGQELAPGLRAGLAVRLDAALDRAGEHDAVLGERLTRARDGLVKSLVEADPHAGPLEPLPEPTSLAPDLPWTLHGGAVRPVGSGLQWLVEAPPGPRSVGKELAALLEAVAWRARTGEVTELRWVGATGGALATDYGAHAAEALDALTDATEFAQAGFFPGDLPSGLSLEREPTPRAEPRRGKKKRELEHAELRAILESFTDAGGVA